MHVVTDPELSEFRERARTWLEENVPAGPRPESRLEAREFDAAWLHLQHEHGWAGVGWPRRFGGLGLSPLQQLVWIEECVRAQAPGMGCFTVALGHAGPTIIECGTPEQQERYLSPILSGNEPWCQGFSEPGSGSDLASLRTSAVIDGDELVISGQKVWTSFAEVADFQELLVRTDPRAPRHRGISWVILDMHAPGVDVRPIRTIDGRAEFAEVFYDDVHVPLGNVVGGVNNGWGVAMTTLGFERGTGYLPNRLRLLNDVDDLIEEARQRGGLKDDRLSEELATLRAEAAAVRSLGYEGMTAGLDPDLVATVNQVFYAELAQRVSRTALDVLGADAVRESRWTRSYLGSLSETILGGTKDIQKNILAERVLGLPR